MLNEASNARKKHDRAVQNTVTEVLGRLRKSPRDDFGVSRRDANHFIRTTLPPIRHEIITDDDKPPGMNERGCDCTVRALANATDIGYAAAYLIMESTGRKPARAGRMDLGLAQFEAEGFGTFEQDLSVFDEKYRTLESVRRFAARNPKGRFIVKVRCLYGLTHVFAVVDGAAIDNEKIAWAKKVMFAWRVFPKEAS